MRLARILIIGIPLLVVMMVGGLLAMTADLTDWDWAARHEQKLRSLAVELEEAICS